MTRLQRALRLIVAWAVFAIASTHLSPAFATCNTVQPVLQAEREVEVGGLRQVSAVSLPDQLTLAQRRPDVKLRYRVDVAACAGAGAVSVYRVGAPYRAWVLDAAGGRQALQPWLPLRSVRDALLGWWGPTVNNGRVPAALVLPAHARVLEVELTSVPYIPSGLVGVEMGASHRIASVQARAFDLLGSGSDLIAGISVFIGLVAVMLSVGRRRDIGLRWFAFGCLIWGVRNLLLLNGELPGDGFVAELFLSQAVAVCGACMAACALHASGHAGPLWRGWLKGFLVMVLLGSGLSILWPQATTAVRLLSFVFTTCTLVGTAYWLIRQPPQASGVSRNLQFLLGLAFVAQVLMGVHDLGIVVGWRPSSSPSLAFWGFSALVIALALLSGSRMVAALGRAENVNAELEQRVTDKNAELLRSYADARDAELLVERRSARLHERERLSREMHDGLGAHLITALRGVERDALSKEQVASALQEGLDELRLLMDASDQWLSLHGALVTWRNRWDVRLSALDICLQWSLDPALESVDLGNDANLQVVRVLQEATTNVVKHARASELSVSAHLVHGVLQIDITDDGQGLPPTPVTESGRGMRNMQQRARHLGALLSVDSPCPDLGRGTRVRLRLHLSEQSGGQRGKQSLSQAALA